MPGIEDMLKGDVPLAPYTTFGIGGPARWFIAPTDAGEFASALSWSKERGVPFFVMGSGANVLVHDEGFDGLVIQTVRLDRIEFQDRTVTAECGVRVDELVDRCVDRNLAGLEFAAGLPGTVGGALFMNARAYEGEFSHVVQRVDALSVDTSDVSRCTLSREELAFAYKRSILQERRHIVYAVRFSLSPSGDIRERADAIRRKRREAGQFTFPNAGCVFRNDRRLGKPTGRIIDELGLKGTRIGDAEVYREHGNFIINRGKATASEVHRLILLVEERVRERLGFELEREIVLLGWEEGGDGPG
jgi:UDP-N-acetylmuramate dehydrogenase